MNNINDDALTRPQEYNSSIEDLAEKLERSTLESSDTSDSTISSNDKLKLKTQSDQSRPTVNETEASNTESARSRQLPTTASPGNSTKVNEVVKALTANNVYLRLGDPILRNNSRGGVFQVFKSGKSDGQKAEAVNRVLKSGNFFFMVCNRKDLNSSILVKDRRNSEDFKDQVYLILEKNTLRFATTEEKQLLRKLPVGNPGERHVAIIREVMADSYGRMAMAYQRARNRYEKLVDEYYKVFKFKLVKTKEPFSICSYDNTPKEYWALYLVTLKRKFKNRWPLKKLFEILQVYNSCDTKHYCVSDRSNISRSCDSCSRGPCIIDGSVPLLVKLNIGGEEGRFMLSQFFVGNATYQSTMENQLLVSTKTNDGNNDTISFKGSTYNSLRNTLNHKTAQFMIDCVENTVASQPTIDRSLKEQLPQIIEFLALTHISECNHGRDYEKCRTPGMNKLARQLLRSIAKQELTFEDAFYSVNSRKSYPPVGGGGTYAARLTIRNITKYSYRQKRKDDKLDEYECVPVTVARCYEMSDDSDRTSSDSDDESSDDDYL